MPWQPSGSGTISPAAMFVLRTPLLPFDELVAWGEGLEAAGAGPHERSAARGPRPPCRDLTFTPV